MQGIGICSMATMLEPSHLNLRDAWVFVVAFKELASEGSHSTDLCKYGLQEI